MLVFCYRSCYRTISIMTCEVSFGLVSCVSVAVLLGPMVVFCVSDGKCILIRVDCIEFMLSYVRN